MEWRVNSYTCLSRHHFYKLQEPAVMLIDVEFRKLPGKNREYSQLRSLQMEMLREVLIEN
jgi:hypothetical protein